MHLARGRIVHWRIAGAVKNFCLLAPPPDGFQTAVVPPHVGNVTVVDVMGAVQKAGEEFCIKVLLEVLPCLLDGR